MALLTDIQDFLQACQKITNFFYRKCFTLEDQLLQDGIVEAITTILFSGEAQDSTVYYMVRALFSAQHQDAITDLKRAIDDASADFRLTDMKMCNIPLEVIELERSDPTSQIRAAEPESPFAKRTSAKF